MIKNLPIALQLYSVRDDLNANFEGTLQRVKDMGFDGVEFAGLYGHSPAQIRELCEKIGLVPISAHVPYVEMAEDPERVLGDYAEIGCSYVAVPYMDEQYRPGTKAFPEVVETMKRLGQIAREKGMTLLYHNHDFEFVKISTADGNMAYGLDVLFDSVPADLLQTELDTCWINVAGEDPVAYLDKYAGRAPMVHLKDFVMAGKKPAKLYALIGIDAGAQETAEGGSFELRPNGYGVQDIPAILDASAKAGAKWIVVEQDEPSMGKSPMECTQMSMDYLNTLDI